MGELKHLSTPRKREYSPSSGERRGKSPNPVLTKRTVILSECGGSGPIRVALTVKLLVVTNARANRRDLERSTIEGESPVSESLERYQVWVPKYHGTRAIAVGSRADHRPRLNTPVDR